MQTLPETAAAFLNSQQIAFIGNIGKPCPVAVIHPALERTLRIDGAAPCFLIIVAADAVPVVQFGIYVTEQRQLKAACAAPITLKVPCHPFSRTQNGMAAGKARPSRNMPLQHRDLVEDLFSLRHLLIDVGFVDHIEILFLLALKDELYLAHRVKEAGKVYEILYIQLFSI